MEDVSDNQSAEKKGSQKAAENDTEQRAALGLSNTSSINAPSATFELPQFDPSPFDVRLGSFDGPIDLLLHLVKSNELQIERISLATVTSQYLECIERMQELDLDIAAEYLVVAATLLSIKAAVLLQDPLDLELEGDANLPDPHRELLERLRAAQIYKEGAQVLGGRDLLGVDVFNRPTTLAEFENPEEVYRPHDAMLLGQAFRKLIERVGKEGFLLKIEIDSVTVVERMVKVLDMLRNSDGPVSFYKLIPDITNRMSLVNSFIALLELCRRSAIRIIQSDNFEDIQVMLSSGQIDENNLTSEFDTPGDSDSNTSDKAVANQGNFTING